MSSVGTGHRDRDAPEQGTTRAPSVVCLLCGPGEREGLDAVVETRQIGMLQTVDNALSKSWMRRCEIDGVFSQLSGRSRQHVPRIYNQAPLFARSCVPLTLTLTLGIKPDK